MNAVRYLNETWNVYTGGVAAAITRKRTHSSTPQGRYEAEFAELLIARRFLKNDGPTKAFITEMETSSMGFLCQRLVLVLYPEASVSF